MIDVPEVIQGLTKLAVVIPYRILQEEIRNVIGPGMGNCWRGFRIKTSRPIYHGGCEGLGPA